MTGRRNTLSKYSMTFVNKSINQKAPSPEVKK